MTSQATNGLLKVSGRTERSIAGTQFFDIESATTHQSSNGVLEPVTHSRFTIVLALSLLLPVALLIANSIHYGQHSILESPRLLLANWLYMGLSQLFWGILALIFANRLLRVRVVTLLALDALLTCFQIWIWHAIPGREGADAWMDVIRSLMDSNSCNWILDWLVWGTVRAQALTAGASVPDSDAPKPTVAIGSSGSKSETELSIITAWTGGMDGHEGLVGGGPIALAIFLAGLVVPNVSVSLTHCIVAGKSSFG